MSDIEITIDPSVRDRVREHSTIDHPIDRHTIESAVRSAASIGGCHDCRVGVRVTNDDVIHQVNCDFLNHDYPTDVISFPYQLIRPMVEGELIVSIDTAIVQASEAGWSIAQELLLYVIHGTLHLVGYNDVIDADRAAMRQAESKAMSLLFPRSDSLSA